MDTAPTVFEIAHTGPVHPGAEVASHRELLRHPGRRALRPSALQIDEPDAWAVRQLTIAGRPQIPARERPVDVPAVVLVEASLELDQVEPGDRVQIVAVNVSDKPRQLFARLVGADVEPPAIAAPASGPS